MYSSSGSLLYSAIFSFHKLTDSLHKYRMKKSLIAIVLFQYLLGYAVTAF